MTTAIRSEFLKFFTTRLWWGMAIGIFVAGGLFAGFFGWALTSEASRNRPGAPQGTPPRSPTPSTPPGWASATCCCSPSVC